MKGGIRSFFQLDWQFNLAIKEIIKYLPPFINKETLSKFLFITMSESTKYKNRKIFD